MDRDKELRQWFSVADDDLKSAEYAKEIRDFVMATKSSTTEDIKNNQIESQNNK
jgi:hypothetical protein